MLGERSSPRPPPLTGVARKLASFLYFVVLYVLVVPPRSIMSSEVFVPHTSSDYHIHYISVLLPTILKLNIKMDYTGHYRSWCLVPRHLLPMALHFLFPTLCLWNFVPQFPRLILLYSIHSCFIPLVSSFLRYSLHSTLVNLVPSILLCSNLQQGSLSHNTLIILVPQINNNRTRSFLTRPYIINSRSSNSRGLETL